MATGSLVDDALLDQFHALSRTPFRRRLAQLNGIPLKREALEAWANKFPDKLAQAEAIYGRLAGYSERLEVQHSGGILAFAARIDAMSDAELLAMTDPQTNGQTSGVTLSPAVAPPKELAAGLEGGQAGRETTQQRVVLASGAS